MVLLRRFVAFWSDFLIGDRPELFVGPILCLVVAWALVSAGVSPTIAGIALFVGVCAVGAFSVGRTLPR